MACSCVESADKSQAGLEIAPRQDALVVSRDEGVREAAAPPVFADGETIYRFVTVVDAQGRIAQQEEHGALSEDIRQRAARPWTYIAKGEEWIYDEHIWAETDAQGQSMTGYEIVRKRNPKRGAPYQDTRPLRVDPKIAQLVQESQPDELLQLSVKLKNFPEWDLPLHPSPLAMSARDYMI
jgi:hypothetical protein